MTPTAIRAQALELVAKAQQSLDDALASGGDTQAARDRLAAAQGKLRALDTHIAPIVDLDAAAGRGWIGLNRPPLPYRARPNR